MANLRSERSSVSGWRSSPKRGLHIFNLLPGIKVAIAAVVALIISFVVTAPAEASDCTPGPGKDLRACYFAQSDLSGEDLSSAQLDGVDLSSANLSGANLSDASLVGSLLTNAVLTESVLIRANASQAVLVGANFGNANLSDADFSLSNLRSTSFRFAIASSTNFSFAVLDQVNFMYSNLDGASFQGAILSNSDMSFAGIAGAQFLGANLEYVKTGSFIGQPASTPESFTIAPGRGLGEIALLGPKSDLEQYRPNTPDCDLSNVILDGSKLMSSNWNGCDLTGISLVDTDMRFANLSYTDLSSARLDGANMSNANLSNAQLDSTSLMGASLNQANLTYSSIQNSNFANAVLTGANFAYNALFQFNSSGGAIGQWVNKPRPYRIVGGYFIGPKSILRGANLSGFDMTFEAMDGTDFTNANLSSSRLYLRGTTETDLSGAVLSDAQLRGDFTRATLRQVESGGVFVPVPYTLTLPTGWGLVNGYLAGPEANLESADFRAQDLRSLNLERASLTNATLTAANLQATRLSGSDLRGVTSGEVLGQPLSVPTGWKFSNGYLAGPGANLQNARLEGSNLSQTDLSGANLTGAILEGATVEGVDLSQATLEGASLDSVIGTPTALPVGWSLMLGNIRKNLDPRESPAITGIGMVGERLAIVLPSWSLPVQQSVEWLRNGAPIPSSNQVTFTAQVEDAEATIAARITVESSGYHPLVLNSAGVNISKGRLGGTPTLSVTTPVTVGRAATATLTSGWQFDVNLVYQWYLNGLPLPGVVSKTYTPQPKDSGKTLSTAVVVTKPGYEDLTILSSGKIVATGTLSTKTPTISGAVKVGSTLTAKTTPWISGAKVSYRWMLDGKAIKGATKSTYKLLSSQKGRRISVSVAQSAAGYTSATKVSVSTRVP